jgi:hypothetical protein
MSFDKANIQFLITNNSCELKVHSKNKCLKVSTSLQYTHKNVNSNILYIIFFISIKIENFGRY